MIPASAGSLDRGSPGRRFILDLRDSGRVQDERVHDRDRLDLFGSASF